MIFDEVLKADSDVFKYIQNLFAALRRKTDFFKSREKFVETVNEIIENEFKKYE